jgi:hypothetical protein
MRRRPTASASAPVTMFQPARPALIWSSEPKQRARLYGSVYVVDAVAARMRLVIIANADGSVIGSSRTMTEGWTLGPVFSASARNSRSNLPHSLVRAICVSSGIFSARACASGNRQPLT